MRLFSFFVVGSLFGIILTKSEAISWFRIHEMFRFESFHMYGILGTAVLLSMLVLAIMKKWEVKTLRNTRLSYNSMPLSPKRHLLAGSLFGLGWALIGSCPGPIFVLLGHGYGFFVLVLLSALLGTFSYGILKDRLPH